MERLSIAEASAALRRGRLSAVSLVERAIENHRAHGAATNAFITFTPDSALAEARDCDADAARGHWRGPLHGIPISFKDLIDVAGTPTTAGSRVLPSSPAARDAEVAARLKAAGAISIGKTNLHEFAFGTTSEDSAFGPVRHPLDATRIAGGSSGGSAAAVAAGIGLGSVGTDTGGSIRIPASICGLVGLKPTHGEVPVEGIVPLSPTLDHAGPIGATVDDAWTMWSVMARRGSPERPKLAVRDLRLGVPRDYFFDLLAEDVRAAWDASIATFTQAGGRVQPVRIPHARFTADAYLPIVFAEACAWHARFLESAPGRYTAPVRTRLEMGRYVLAEDYARAMTARDVLTREVDAALTGVDALALPAMAISAPPLGTTEIRFGAHAEPIRAVMLRLTQLFDITGHPAITLPMAPAAPPHLPAGLQLAGRRHQTAVLLSVARAVEAALV